MISGRFLSLLLFFLILLSACNRPPTFSKGPVQTGPASRISPGEIPSWIAAGDREAFSRFGGALSVGDVNADGFDDLVVGAHTFNSGEDNSGKIYLYLGSPQGLSAEPSWQVIGSGQQGEEFGVSVACGDIDGDGRDDIAVGAMGYAHERITHAGRVSVFLSGPDGFGNRPVWTSTGEGAVGAAFGADVALGDVNGDGFADLLVGANGYGMGEKAGAGKVYLYFGSKRGLAGSFRWSSDGDDFGHASFGYPIGLWDMNADGKADLLASAIGFYGKSFLFIGKGWVSKKPVWTSIGEKQGGSLFGVSLAAGDVNGDGYVDLAVGASAYDHNRTHRTDAGKIYLFSGSEKGLSQDPVWGSTGDDRVDALFATSAAMGDVNGDGYADLLVGAEAQTQQVVNAGKAFLFLGSREGLLDAPSWIAKGSEIDHAFFGKAATMGDFNGDGLKDLVVAAPHEAVDGAERAGRVYLYPGRREGG